MKNLNRTLPVRGNHVHVWGLFCGVILSAGTQQHKAPLITKAFNDLKLNHNMQSMLYVNTYVTLLLYSLYVTVKRPNENKDV